MAKQSSYVFTTDKTGITVEYKFNRNGRKWQFVTGNYTLLQSCKGVEQAHLVARQVAGAVARNKNGTLPIHGLDNLARKTISKIVTA